MTQGEQPGHQASGTSIGQTAFYADHPKSTPEDYLSARFVNSRHPTPPLPTSSKETCPDPEINVGSHIPRGFQSGRVTNRRRRPSSRVEDAASERRKVRSGEDWRRLEGNDARTQGRRDKDVRTQGRKDGRPPYRRWRCCVPAVLSSDVEP